MKQLILVIALMWGASSHAGRVSKCAGSYSGKKIAAEILTREDYLSALKVRSWYEADRRPFAECGSQFQKSSLIPDWRRLDCSYDYTIEMSGQNKYYKSKSAMGFVSEEPDYHLVLTIQNIRVDLTCEAPRFYTEDVYQSDSSCSGNCGDT